MELDLDTSNRGSAPRSSVQAGPRAYAELPLQEEQVFRDLAVGPVTLPLAHAQQILYGFDVNVQSGREIQGKFFFNLKQNVVSLVILLDWGEMSHLQSE